MFQLSHFGEVFDSQKCKMSLATCDNCRASGKQEKKDVTVLVKSILKGLIRCLPGIEYYRHFFVRLVIFLWF